MQQSQLTIRIDKELKNKAKIKAEKMGLNLSLITKMFYSSFVKKEGGDIIQIDVDSVFDEALKSKELRSNLIKMGNLAKKKYA